MLLALLLSLTLTLLFVTSASTAPGDEHWDDRFLLAGVNGSVTALTVLGSDVYAGGFFWSVGADPVNGIARWDGTNWFDVGGGVTGGSSHATSFATKDGDLYVGGSFTHAGGVAAKNIARWDGTNWSALGSGVAGYVRTLVFLGDDLYVGGNFYSAGGVTATNLAKWDGTNWSPVGGGVSRWWWHLGWFEDSTVRCLGVKGDSLIVGGDFELAGDNRITNIVEWDGTNWKQLGAGMPGYNEGVGTIAVKGDDVFLGGNFRWIPGVLGPGVAKWDGTNWSALPDSNFEGAQSLLMVGNDLYVGGGRITAGTITATGVAKWDGVRWHALAGDVRGVDGYGGGVFALATDGSRLFVGGVFGAAGATRANNTAIWNGTSWVPMEKQINALGIVGSSVNTIHILGDHVYVGGQTFLFAGATEANSVARWDGSGWSGFADGLSYYGRPGLVSTLAAQGTNMLVAGWFDSAGDVKVLNLARWDGQRWSAVEGLGSGYVGVIKTYGDDFLMGGGFELPGGFRHFAKWNPTTGWSGFGANPPGPVGAIATGIGQLFVAGKIVGSGNTEFYISRWDNPNWTRIVTDTNNYFDHLAIIGTNLYAAGSFRSIGGVSVNFLGRWDGYGWSAVGDGLNSDVHALAVSGTDLYVAGDFSTAGGLPASRVAKWDGTKWTGLGSGVNDRVTALAATGSEVYIGGQFTVAGETLSSRFALWHIPHALSIGQAADQLRLSWPATGTNFVLEAKDDVAGTNWSEVSRPPALHNNECVVTEPLNGSNRFYRLRRR